MRIVNTGTIEWLSRTSPGGKFGRAEQKISEALGRDPRSTDLNERHPFDVELTKIPAGRSSCPYHSHSAQWEFFHVISGKGRLRHDEGTVSIEAGDAFIFKPDQPHQIINDSERDLVLYVIADNPIGGTCFYPDSTKWAVQSPEHRLIRGEPLDYFDGEE